MLFHSAQQNPVPSHANLEKSLFVQGEKNYHEGSFLKWWEENWMAFYEEETTLQPFRNIIKEQLLCVKGSSETT